jgi:aminoglycoside phosphotransferase (APT) family kinase protein
MSLYPDPYVCPVAWIKRSGFSDLGNETGPAFLEKIMTNNPVAPLSIDVVQALLKEIAPGGDLLTFNLLPGSFSNSTHIVKARLANGNDLKLVVRRYAVFGDYDRGEKARREFKTFEYLHRYGVPAPEPLYLDETGALLGMPGIVTRFVPGRLMLSVPADPHDWACKLAVTLAKIHSIPCDTDARSFLLDANAEATWFLNSDTMPGYMQTYPGGSDTWQILRAAFPGIQPMPSGLVHIDYWSGNILWHRKQISAVLDWEEASYGDPIIDVAYARMNMVLMGLTQSADDFLHIYESEMGCKAENLGFWELAAAARPMVDPGGWQVSDNDVLNNAIFKQFMAEARKRLS